MLQQTPRTEISSPPLLVISPPVVTELIVISVAAVVLRTAREGSFLQLLMKKTRLPGIPKIENC